MSPTEQDFEDPERDDEIRQTKRELERLEWADPSEPFDRRMVQFLNSGDETVLHAPDNVVPVRAWKMYAAGLVFAACALLGVLWINAFHARVGENTDRASTMTREERILQDAQAVRIYPEKRLVQLRRLSTREELFVAQGDPFGPLQVEHVSDFVILKLGARTRRLTPDFVSKDRFWEAGSGFAPANPGATDIRDVRLRESLLDESFRDWLTAKREGIVLLQDEMLFRDFIQLFHDMTRCPLWVSEHLMFNPDPVRIFATSPDWRSVLLENSSQSKSYGKWEFWSEVAGGRAYLRVGTADEFAAYMNRVSRSEWDLTAVAATVDFPGDPAYVKTMQALRDALLKEFPLSQPDHAAVSGTTLHYVSRPSWRRDCEAHLYRMTRIFEKELMWEKLGLTVDENEQVRSSILGLPAIVTANLSEEQQNALVGELAKVIRKSMSIQSVQEVSIDGGSCLIVSATRAQIRRIQDGLATLTENPDLYELWRFLEKSQ